MMKHKNKLISISLATIVLVSMVAVVSLSASAAPTVKTAVGSAPATTSIGGGKYWVFVKGSDGNLYYTKDATAAGPVWNAAPGLSAPTGGMTSDLAVIYTAGPGASWNVFVRGSDGGLWTKSSTDGATGNAWTAWTEISGPALAAGTGPAVYQWMDAGVTTRLGVFYVGTSNELEHIYQPGGAGFWSPPQNLGGYVSASPSATVMLPATSGVVDVFVRGQSGALWMKEYATGAFGGWSEVPGLGYLLAGTGPAAVSLRSGEMDVFVTGGGGGLWQQHYGFPNNVVTTAVWQTAGAGLSAYTPLGGVLTASPGATGTAGPPNCQVFVRGGEGNLYSKYVATTAAGATTPTGYPWQVYVGPLNSPV